MFDFTSASAAGSPEPDSAGTSAHSDATGATDPEPGPSAATLFARGRARQQKLERLSDEIARLAAHITAATYRLLCLIREFDEGEGWHEAGFRSCAEWLSWRTGTAPGAAREKVRVARALVTLPALSNSLRTGQLSYSAARALTRVATPQNEAELVETARHTTAADLERLVAGWKALDRALDVEGERERHRQRALWVVPDANGSWRVQGRLDPEVGALLCRALEAAAEALYAGDAPDPESDPEARRADALGLVAEAALGKGLGMRVERKPETGANPEAAANSEPGAETPKSAPAPVVGRAERFQVVVHVSAETLAGKSAARNVESRIKAGESAARNVESRIEAGEAAGRTDESRIEAGPHVSAETSRRLACDAGVVVMTHDGQGSVLDVGRRTRTVPPALRRALDCRDGTCRFPGCACRYCDAHHLRHWADGGETKLENLTLLCRRHHRLLHEEGWRVKKAEGGELRFYRPGGQFLPRVPVPPELWKDVEGEDLGEAAGEARWKEPVAALEREQRGLGIDSWTATSRWQGERLDLDWALFTLYTPPSQDSNPDSNPELSSPPSPELRLDA